MKSWLHVLVVGGLIAGLGAASVGAHEDGGEAKGKSHEWAAGRLKEKLGLSDDQVVKMKAAFQAKRDAEKPLRHQLREGVEKLRAQLTLKQSEADIKTTLDQIEKTRKALAAEREKFRSSMDAMLTVQQRAKMLVAFEGRRHEFMKEHERREHHEGAWWNQHGDKRDKDSKQGAEEPNGEADE